MGVESAYSTRNVNTGFFTLYNAIQKEGLPSDSRNGPVLRWPTPIIVTYENPCERVLFDETRDHNYFFAFFESLWMLAGRDDLEFLSLFNKNMANYSDDGKLIRGSAYGRRWRDWFGYDQISHVIHELQDNPTSRRCVLTMWDATSDPLVSSKDIPCNTQAYVEVDNWGEVNLTVLNRSNDLVYGMFGSNAVHFSFLLEYIAANLGRKVGVYHQFSNNLHLYTDFPITKKIGPRVEVDDPYSDGRVSTFPMFRRGDEDELRDWDIDLQRSFDLSWGKFETEFFCEVVHPMRETHRLYRMKKYDEALATCEKIKATDIRYNAREWLNRRITKR